MSLFKQWLFIIDKNSLRAMISHSCVHRTFVVIRFVKNVLKVVIWMNPCCAKFPLRNIKTCLYFLPFINTEMAQVAKIFPFFGQNPSFFYFFWPKSFLRVDKDLFILHSQYHGCWWPGDARSQGISNHDIDLFLSEYSSFRAVRVKICPFSCTCNITIKSLI